MRKQHPKTRTPIATLLKDLRESEDDILTIAARYDMTSSAITQRLKKHLGITPTQYRSLHGWYGRLPPSRTREVRAAYSNGQSMAEIAEAFSMPYDVIRDMVGVKNLRTDAQEKALIAERRRKISPTKHDEIVRRYLAGESCVDLAPHYGVTEKTIRLILESCGVRRRAQAGVPREQMAPLPAPEVIVQEYCNGMSISEIARKYDCGPWRIRPVILRAGIKPRMTGWVHARAALAEKKAAEKAAKESGPNPGPLP